MFECRKSWPELTVELATKDFANVVVKTNDDPVAGPSANPDTSKIVGHSEKRFESEPAFELHCECSSAFVEVYISIFKTSNAVPAVPLFLVSRARILIPNSVQRGARSRVRTSPPTPSMSSKNCHLAICRASGHSCPLTLMPKG